MKKLLALAFLFASTAFGANEPLKTFVTGATAAATNDGTELVYEVQAGGSVKATSAAVGNSGTLTGDCTKATADTAVTCTKTNGVAFAASATTDTTNATNLASGTVAAARGGAGAITGALKGNGSGVVSQAACADLSNAAASCSTDATNATNISSGTLAAGRLPTNGANPTAVVGSTAVNGIATTWMRSDAAPAIDLTFSPTWTGTHTFNNPVTAASFIPTSSTVPSNGLYLSAANTLALSTSSASRVTISTTAMALGSASITFGSGNMSGGNFTVTGTGVPGNGIYRVNSTTLGFGANSVAIGQWNSSGLTNTVAYVSTGTKPTVTGCSNSTTLGGAVAGSYVSGTTGTCTVTITLPTGPTTGYACFAHDTTTAADYTQSAITSSVNTLTISGTTISGDVIVWGCPLGF